MQSFNTATKTPRAEPTRILKSSENRPQASCRDRRDIRRQSCAASALTNTVILRLALLEEASVCHCPIMRESLPRCAMIPIVLSALRKSESTWTMGGGTEAPEHQSGCIGVASAQIGFAGHVDRFLAMRDSKKPCRRTVNGPGNRVGAGTSRPITL